VRYAILRIADDDQEALEQVAAALAAVDWRPNAAQRLLGQAEVSRGALLGELIGLPDAALDQAPAPGEWPVRLVLGHTIVTERRYLQRTAWHVAEARAGRPTTAEPPPGSVTPLADFQGADAAGDLATLRERLATVREAVLAGLAECDTTDLAAPTSWAGYTVDVRFRLHRFASHERQHTVQLARTRRSIGLMPSEVQLLLAQAAVTRGHLLALLVGLPDELARRVPATGPSVEQVLADLWERDRGRLADLREALAD
jgi:hypothetical protein